MRKRKPKPPTSPQHQALALLRDLGATSPAAATRLNAEVSGNTLNRVTMRGWIAREGTAAYLTAAGAVELARLEQVASQ